MTIVPSRQADVEALGALLQLALDTVVATFERARVELPARRYVSYGSVAADCEQLTVEFAQAYAGTPGADPNQVQPCNGPRTAVLVVQLFRRAPTPSGPRSASAPSSADITDFTLRLTRDAWLLLDAAGTVGSVSWPGQGSVIAEVSPIDTSGAYTGSSLTLTLKVP